MLDTTAHVLSTRGFACTSLTEVARIAGLRPPAVYHYFASKDDLVAAALSAGQQLVRQRVAAAAAAAGPDVRRAVDAMVEAHLRVELDSSAYATAVTRNARHVPPAIAVQLGADSAAFHDVWREVLQRAASEGHLRLGLDARVARMLVVGALNWAAEWYTPRISVDSVVATAQQLVRAGLFQPPHPSGHP
nr:TetR/AcrR family transcriptional regulator [Nocardioides zeae]